MNFLDSIVNKTVIVTISRTFLMLLTIISVIDLQYFLNYYNVHYNNVNNIAHNNNIILYNTNNIVNNIFYINKVNNMVYNDNNIFYNNVLLHCYNVRFCFIIATV